MPSRRRHAPEAHEPGVDLTPMLDVVFILLIFFVVTASFVEETGLEVDRPTSGIILPNDPPIVISIASDDAIEVERRRVDFRAVTANVARARAEFPNRPLVLRVSEAASNGTFVRVLDQVRLAEVRPDELVRVSVVGQP